MKRVGGPRRGWLDGVKRVLLGGGHIVVSRKLYMCIVRDKNKCQAFTRGRLRVYVNLPRYNKVVGLNCLAQSNGGLVIRTY